MSDSVHCFSSNGDGVGCAEHSSIPAQPAVSTSIPDKPAPIQRDIESSILDIFHRHQHVHFKFIFNGLMIGASVLPSLRAQYKVC